MKLKELMSLVECKNNEPGRARLAGLVIEFSGEYYAKDGVLSVWKGNKSRATKKVDYDG